MAKGDSVIDLPSSQQNIVEAKNLFDFAYSEHKFVPTNSMENSETEIRFTPIYDAQTKDGTKTIERADGETVIVTTGKDGKPTSVTIGDGKYTRKPNGTWTSNSEGDADYNLKVSVSEDGSYTIDRESKNERGKRFSHTSASDGTVILKFFEKGVENLEVIHRTDGNSVRKESNGTRIYQNADGTEVTHTPDGSVTRKDEFGTYEKRKDGLVVIKPVTGGQIVADNKAGKMDVTYPDGVTISYETSEDERKNFAAGFGARVLWKKDAPTNEAFKEQDPKDLHHFLYRVLLPSDSADPPRTTNEAKIA